jgi:hypothetical protein
MYLIAVRLVVIFPLLRWRRVGEEFGVCVLLGFGLALGFPFRHYL